MPVRQGTDRHRRPLRRPAERTVLPSNRRFSRGRLRATIGIALLLLAGYGARRASESDLLRIGGVQVVGAAAVSEDAVRDAAGIEGNDYFSVDRGAVAARVESLAWVKHASVQLHFPHSATITVVERQPIGVWRVGAVDYLVDDYGFVLDSTSGGGQLPVIDASFADGDVQVGQRVDPDPLRTAQRVQDYAQRTLGVTIARFQYDKATGLTAQTERGVQVHLGDGRDLEYKLAVWQAVTGKVSPTDIHELDLRYGDKPFYR